MTALAQARPRTRNAAASRARILAAAEEVFSTHTYGQAGVRVIAARAGVNAALVLRYFGSKEQLFEEALQHVHAGVGFWADKGPDFGRTMARRLIDLGSAPNPLPMLVLASADPSGRARAMELVEKHLVAPLAAWIGEPDGRARAERILTVCAGFFTWRTLLPLPTLSDTLSPSSVAWLETALQQALDS